MHDCRSGAATLCHLKACCNLSVLEDTLDGVCCLLGVGGTLGVGDVVRCPVQSSTDALLQDIALTSCTDSTKFKLWKVLWELCTFAQCSPIPPLTSNVTHSVYPIHHS